MEEASEQFDETALVPGGADSDLTWVIAAARVANEKAREGLLERYLQTCADQTIRRHNPTLVVSIRSALQATWRKRLLTVQ